MVSKLSGQFAAIFGEASQEGGEAGETEDIKPTTFMTQYTWQIWFDRVANGNFLQWEEVERLPVYRFLNIMTFIICKDQHEEQQRIKSK